MIPAALYSLYGIRSLTTPQCEPPYGPITSSNWCELVGSHALAIVAPIVLAVALWLLVRDIRALARR